MRADVSPYDVVRNTFWFGSEPVPSDPGIRRIADCVAAARPGIERLSRVHGDRTVIWALAAIIVDAALEAGNGAVVAAILRTNARLIEVEAGGDLLGFDGMIGSGGNSLE